MKWTKLLWSVIILGSIALILAWLTSRSTGGIISAWFPFALLIWLIVSLCSPAVLILRLLRTIRSADSFIYIFTGTANLATGIPGIVFGSHDPTSDIFIFIGFVLNVLFGAFIFIDAFLITIPGFVRER